MITHQQHLQRILDSVESLPSTSVDLTVGARVASGMTLASDVVSRGSLPPFTNSAMDGYAIVADDVSVGDVVQVTGDIPAGDTRELRQVPGEAWRIMTGAALPEGADTVVPVEMTDAGVKQVTFNELPQPKRNVRYAGEDVKPDEVVLPAGTYLAPHDIAILASAGVDEAEVVPRPKVAIVSTGDELVRVGQPLEHGQIYDSNGPMLAALVQAAGAELHSIFHLTDDEAQVAETLSYLTADGGADVIVTTGGVSAGAFDVVKSALIEAGEVSFDKVTMQPGKPQGFGLIGDRRVPVFTLPGNPMSSLVSFHVFVLPALRKMAARSEIRHLRGRAASAWTPPKGRTQFARVWAKPTASGFDIMPNAHQGSHFMGELFRANALAVVPADVETVREGAELDLIPLLGEEL